MRSFISVILMLVGFQAFTQENFDSGINSLVEKYNFEIVENSYKKSNIPDKSLVDRFKRCSTFETTFPLANLNYDQIINSKYIEVKSNYWKGPVSLTFHEWTFSSKTNAKTFLRILNSVPHHHVQDFVSKGGLQWWIVNHKIYILTSRAYFATYHFDEIISAFKS